MKKQFVVRNYPGYHVRRMWRDGDPESWKIWRHPMRGIRWFVEWKLTNPKLRNMVWRSKK